MKKIALILLATLLFTLATPTTSYATDKEEENYSITYDESDVELLARLVAAESGGESYLGQLAVANNVVNRCLDTYYPDTIRANIYKSGQYTPVRNGLRSTYSESAYKAAYDVLVNGVRVLPYWALNFQVANTRAYKYTRIGNHTFNYRIHNDNLWRVWCDAVEEPQYFIDRLSDKQIEIALESMPQHYTFDWLTKTISFTSVKDTNVVLMQEIQDQRIEIENLNVNISDLQSQLADQMNITNVFRVQYKHEKQLVRKYETENDMLNLVVIILILIIFGLIYKIIKLFKKVY